MGAELSQASLFLSKTNATFDGLINTDALPNDAKKLSFEFEGTSIVFYYFNSTSSRSSPPWLDFVNDQLPKEKQISFATKSTRPNGIILINTNDRIFVMTFGISSASAINKSLIVHDFGIRAAMNMCGNDEIRQTRSRTHSIATQHIDRQISRPSDTSTFGMSEHEILSYISAQIPENEKVTIQGKDSLTIKAIGKEKISWEKLIEHCNSSIENYEKDDYRELFPNYPNLKEVSQSEKDTLDEYLVNEIKNGSHDTLHMSIPEFIKDDEFGFSYGNRLKSDNIVYSHIDLEHLKTDKNIKLEKLNLKQLKSRSIFAYSYTEEKILPYKRWSLYNCFVYEVEMDNKYYVFSNGLWQQVDKEFQDKIDKFISNELKETEIEDKYKNININCDDIKQNREEKFNEHYCTHNKNSVKFDQAKLKIGTSKKDKEFCDILEFNDLIAITHVKRYGTSQSLIQLFSQSRFYCESFLMDQTFLTEIRKHISTSKHENSEDFLERVKDKISEIFGTDYCVRLWILYDKNKKKPDISKLPLMAKYELKLMHDRLRNICKFTNIELCMIPVQQVNYKTAKKGTPRAAK